MHQESQSNFLKDETSNLKLNQEVILYESKRYIPYFMGGYYADFAPIPPYDPFDFILEFLCVLAMILNWIFFQAIYDELQDYVPLFYNSKGQVYITGDKLILYTLPTLGTFFFVILSILQLITNRFKYEMQITPENAKFVFHFTRKFVMACKFITMCLFIYITIGSLQVIRDNYAGYLMAYAVLAVIFYGLSYNVYTIHMATL